MIIVCEPQCHGFEHVDFNYGLLLSLRSAYPDEVIEFYGERSHVKLLENKFTSRELSSLHLRPVEVPHRKVGNGKRFLPELKLIYGIFRNAKKKRAKRVFYSSSTSPGIYSIWFVQLFHKGIDCAVVAHGVLETILERPKKWHAGIPFWYKYPLSLCVSSKLRLLVLGNSIRENLLKVLPGLGHYVHAIDHPYPNYGSNPRDNLSQDSMVIGFLGVANRIKGTDLFIELVRTFKKNHPNLPVKFQLIGHVADSALKQHLAEISEITFSENALTESEYHHRLRGVTYAAFFNADPSYSLRASGTFLDAMSHGIPIISLRNKYIEYYFNKMGDIGHLCDSLLDMERTICELANTKFQLRYQSQAAIIKKERYLFNPKNVAMTLREMWE